MSNKKKTGDVDIKVVMLDELGASFFKKSIPSKTGKGSIELGLWDTAGQERYDSLSVPAEDCFVILVGTKSDLGKPVITEKKVEDLISNNRLIYKHFVTSAKDGTNVSTIFDTIAEEYERRKATNQNRRSSIGMVPISQLQTNSDTSLKKGCCG
nr:unnamed protein product [Naegleria fowleri]